jgi:hypothetical protein
MFYNILVPGYLRRIGPDRRPPKLMHCPNCGTNYFEGAGTEFNGCYYCLDGTKHPSNAVIVPWEARNPLAGIYGGEPLPRRKRPARRRSSIHSFPVSWREDASKP